MWTMLQGTIVAETITGIHDILSKDLNHIVIERAAVGLFSRA